MAEKIKSYEKITASVVNSLLTDIIELYQKRDLLITGTDRNGNSISQNLASIGNSYSKTITTNNKINKSDLGDILDKVLIINDQPKLLLSTQYNPVLKAGSTNDILEWVADYKELTGTASNHGCRGACVGLCKGSCYGEAYGTNNNQGGDSVDHGSYYYSTSAKSFCSCGGGCYGDCDWSCTNVCYGVSNDNPVNACGGDGCGSSCYDNCDSDCNDHCDSTCKGNCWKGCGGCNTGCTNSCSGCGGDCTHTCKENCGNTCRIGCSSQCQNQCHNSCKDGCAWNCKDGCYGTAKDNTYT